MIRSEILNICTALNEASTSDGGQCDDHISLETQTASTDVALYAVVGTVVAIPEYWVGATTAANLVSYWEFDCVVDDAEVVGEGDGEAELIRRSAAGSVDVAGGDVGVCQPAIHCVADRDPLVVGDVGDADDAVDAVRRRNARLEADATVGDASGEVPRHAGLREARVE